MKCLALTVDFNGVRFDPLGSRNPPYERIKFGYPLENVRFLLLSTNLAREWLQIDTDLLRIITSTADEIFGGTNIDDLERPWTPQSMGFKWIFRYFRLRVNFRWNVLEMDHDNRQPAHEIKLMLSRVPWALAQISCSFSTVAWILRFSGEFLFCSINDFFAQSPSLYYSYRQTDRQTIKHMQLVTAGSAAVETCCVYRLGGCCC